jgi:hypothetical protein
MTEQTPPVADNAPTLRRFTLDFDVKLGEQVIIGAGTVITVRKPGSPELRGLTLAALAQLDVNALHDLAPRITSPVIHKNATMDPADLMQLGGEVMDFLLPTAARPAASPTA